jgi:predicted nucleic acid-binding protein
MRTVLPVTAVIGAYHITTRYLKVSRLEVKKVLEGLLRTRSPALYPNVRPELAVDALDYAVAYDIESWDGYLIALARSLQAKIIYSLDEGLAKVREITVVNPFPSNKLQEYHSYLKEKIA